jgi:uncharacterized membrane protein YfcA
MDPLLIAGIVISVFLGGQVGPSIAARLDKKLFKKICGVFVLGMGIYFIGT